MKKLFAAMIVCYAMVAFAGCKMDNFMKGINVEKLTADFLDSWKAQDWKKMYATIHSSTIVEYRKHQTDAQKKMNDADFFAEICREKARKDPSFILKEYTIVRMPIVRKANQDIKVLVKINGSDKSIPIRLDGIALKVDYINIK